MSMVFKNLNFCLLASVLVLSSCGYTNKSSHQKVTFMTPDAKDAICYVYINKLKHKVYPPESLTVTNSSDDMLVECEAPGNRAVSIKVPAKFYNKAIWGGPAGVAWDYASRSSHSYPSVVAIDFSQQEVMPNEPPSHNNSDIMQPEDHDLEEFRPSTPRMNSDKNKGQAPILHRGEEYPSEMESVLEDTLPSDEIIVPEEQAIDAVTDEKVDLQSVIDSLPQDEVTSDVSSVEAETVLDTPAVGASETVVESVEEENPSDVVAEPVQIYPGQ
ncbi:MAG: hypothetical protein ACRBCK_09490 [Alphaproteobacteria bacterium]